MNVKADREFALNEINRLNAAEELPPVEMLEGTVASPNGILWYQVVTDHGETFFVTTSVLKDLEKYGEKVTTASDIDEVLDHDGGEWV